MRRLFTFLTLAVWALGLWAASAPKAAMLQLSSPSTMEQNAISWFQTNGKGDVITSLDKLNDYSVLWVMIDRVGLERGIDKLPLSLIEQTAIANWVKAGGNLLVTGQATQLVEGIGRTSGFLPGIYGNGNGGDNHDVWGIQPVIGNTYNHMSHDIYKSLATQQFEGHAIYPLIGDGKKMDHNCMWDLNSYSLSPNPDIVKDFENRTTSSVLGTWQQVVDFCCAGIVEFAPTSVYKGIVLANGLAAYDWQAPQSSDNMKTLTSNMLSYLKANANEITPPTPVTVGTKVGMLQLSGASTTEQAAISWFRSNVSGDVITSLDNISDYKMLWIMIDRVGLNRGYANLPLTAAQRETLSAWVKAGGNLLLTNHATQLVEGIGRTSGYEPTLFGSGNGGDNPDLWGVGVLNAGGHDIYKSLKAADFQGKTYYPLINAGFKFDHNCMWENINPANFESVNNAKCLGTWQQQGDFSYVGIVEFKPTSIYKGTILVCGLAAFDWAANANENFKPFASNMINYLAPGSGSVTPDPDQPGTDPDDPNPDQPGTDDPVITVGSKVAMLKLQNGISQMEQNAIKWFNDTNKGDVITSLDNLSDYGVLWVMIDRVGLNKGAENLPLTSEQRNTIAAWTKAGGKLLLTNHATQLVEAIGRTSDYAPNIYNSNAANNNPDVWGIAPDTEFAKNHVIYSNLTSATSANDNLYFPLINAGNKMDHNCMWNLLSDGGYNTTVDAFESATTSKVLGTWQQNKDLLQPAVVEFLPTPTFKGTILACGIAAFDWQAPAYKKNLNNFAANMLSYLSTGNAAEPEVTPQPQAGLIAHFDMEVSGNQVSDLVSSSRYNVNHRLDAYLAKGAKGNCMRFDGYSNFADVNIDVDGMASQQLTLSLWCAPQTYPSVTTMDNAGEGWTSVFGNNAMAFRMSSRGQYAFDCRVGGQDLSCLAPSRIPCSEWSHLVVTIDGKAGKVSFYRNGQKVSEKTCPAGEIELGNSAWVIGKDLGGADGNCYLNTFCGLIDEVKVYNGIQSSELTDNSPSNPVDMNYDIERRYGNNILRPRFHGMPDGNWTNETHGLTFYDGKYHVFFQKNANAPIMCHMQWGHITSENLYKWTEEKVALMPLDNYEFKGTWSGCVFQDPDFNSGKPTILYTAVDNAKASIAMASPLDSHLLDWRKDGQIVPGKPGGLSDDFRDPNFFTANGKKYFIVGTAKDGRGACTLHRYENGHWTNDGSIFFHPAAGNGTFWEMPNVTPMGDGKYLFTVTPLGTSVGVKTIYWIGTINGDGTFNPTSGPYDFEMAGTSKDGYGLLSPSIYQKDGKTICLGIVPDKVAGELNAEWGWAHNYSLPREISLSADGRTIVQKPYIGLSGMRSSASYSATNVNLNNRSQSLGSISGRQVEMIGEFAITKNNGGNMQQGFRFLKNGNRYASLYYQNGEVVLDLNNLDRIAQDNVYGGRYVSQLPMSNGSTLKFHVFLDGSIADIFVNDTFAFSVRLFPTDANATGVEAFATGNATVKQLSGWTLSVDNNNATAISNVESEPDDTARKFIDGRRVIITRGNKTYNVVGAMMR